jgi:transposase
MRPKGVAAELERRRRRAAALLRSGRGVRDVARVVGASPSSVSRWKRVLDRLGLRGLAAKPNAGRPHGLSAAQRRRLAGLLGRGPLAQGYVNGLWTLGRVAAVIRRRFGRRYHVSSVWHLLRAMQ